MHRTEVIAVAGSLGLLLLVLELVRRRRLKEKYALLWLFTALVQLGISLCGGIPETVSRMMGIYYPPAAFFLLAFLFLMFITLQFSVVISKLTERNKNLAQKVAILRDRVEDLEKSYDIKDSKEAR